MARGVGTSPGSPSLARGLIALALAIVASCAEPRRADNVPVDARASRVDVFLGASSAVPHLRVLLDRVELIDVGGDVLELALAKDMISSEGVGARSAIAGGVVTPTRYSTLVLTVRGASLVQGEQEIPLRLLPALVARDDMTPAEAELAAERGASSQRMVYRFPLNLVVGKHHAASLFINWNVEESLAEGGFRPVLSTSLETRQTRLGILYVTDAATGSILGVDRARGRVVATGKVGAAPTALALSRDRRRLYVANGGDGSLTVVDTQRNFADLTMPIRLGAATSDVTLAEAERLVAATNPGLDTVSFFSMQDGSRVQDVRVGRKPVQIVSVASIRRMFALNERSNDVSVIELGTRGVVATIPVESTPSCLAVDRTEEVVYVGHRVSPNLLVIEAESLRLLDPIYVGANVTAVLGDRRRDRVYVARSRPPELAIVDRRLSSVVRRIPLSGVVVNLAQPIEGPFLYGASPDQGGLVVIDVVVGVEKALLPCGTTPTDVVASD